MHFMPRFLVPVAGVALLVAGCSTASSPSPSTDARVRASESASESASASASPSVAPTPIPTPTPTPGPTPVGEQNLALDLTLNYQGGQLDGPGTCIIGVDGIWIYLDHRTGGALDAYLTVGKAQGGVGGGPITGGGHFGPDAVRVRIYDHANGGFTDTEGAQADLAPDLRSGTFSGTWKGVELTATYICS